MVRFCDLNRSKYFVKQNWLIGEARQLSGDFAAWRLMKLPWRPRGATPQLFFCTCKFYYFLLSMYIYIYYTCNHIIISKFKLCNQFFYFNSIALVKQKVKPTRFIVLLYNNFTLKNSPIYIHIKGTKWEIFSKF